MKLKTGKISNIERKFIPIRNSKLEKYLNNLELVEKYMITQYYNGIYKYRKFEQDKDIKYTKSRRDGDNTIVEEIRREEYFREFNKNKFIVKQRSVYRDGEYIVEVDEFKKPTNLTMIEVSSDFRKLDDYEPEETFIEVTDNSIYKNENISRGSIKKSNVIIEGTDGVGKTTTIIKLIKDGIVCQDRCEEVISKNMLFDISDEERAKKIYQRYFGKNTNNETVIFLINLDKEELKKRIQSRDVISEFDLEAYEYGLLYKQTYEYMMKKYNIKNGFFMVNCTGLNIEEQYKKVKDFISKERSCDEYEDSIDDRM